LPLKLSIVIPAHNEADSIRHAVTSISDKLAQERIPNEILVVNDHSSDGTADVLTELAREHENLRWIENTEAGGFGYAIRAGLAGYTGDAVCVVMADSSDDPADIVQYYRKLEEGYECVFGSRFIRGGRVVDYPLHKLVMNRLANLFIKGLFRIPYNDVTNAFKCYRRAVIDGVSPIFSCHFNLTVELPLKAIVRGYTYSVIPIRWYNRTAGISKLRIKEMGSRYLFIVLYIWLEKLLSRGDYHRAAKPKETADAPSDPKRYVKSP
jgi:dolichol-phosphate mannosyltransferase